MNAIDISSRTTWPETESKVWCPALWLPVLVGGVFLACGVLIFVVPTRVPPGTPAWAPLILAGVAVVSGAALLIWSTASRLWPSRIRHAEIDVLPNVPAEPVLQEGAIVFGRVTHELAETIEAWEFRPAESIARSDRRFLLGFGIPFLIVFSGILTWIFLHQKVFPQQLNWALSAFSAILVTAMCGGTCFTLIGLMLRMGFSRLPRFTIPHGGDDLEWQSPLTPEISSNEQTGPVDPKAVVTRMFFEEVSKEVRKLTRERVVAVQLCPWKFVVGSSNHRMTTWAVQGLIVLANPQTETYDRYPVLLTSHFTGAARLMRQLSEVLRVPYLFGGTAEGWKAEFQRAKSRPPLRSGGMQN